MDGLDTRSLPKGMGREKILNVAGKHCHQNFINIDDKLSALKSKHTQLKTALKREQKRP
tara:strand:+ start:369 stop:545 length:177 start_codon:yes stop_codon:yes gene_type:complete